MRKVAFSVTLMGLLALSCGEGKISVDPEQYKPKIAIEGILIPHQKVDRIFIWRNFPVDDNLQRMELALSDANVTITDIANDISYTLTYNPDFAFFQYNRPDLVIDYGKNYKLEVSAKIDGENLTASSITTVPEAGMEILSVNFDSLTYRSRDAIGNIINFNLQIERSPGTGFYLATILALDADPATFIYDNPFTDETPEDVASDLDDYRYNYTWIQDTPLTPGTSALELFWFDFWFIGRYEVIVFAADKNYQDFLKTYNDVQEIDGNYHEPVFHIDGDGIGVFGSALVDTVYLNVIQ
ncbi:MAG: hypothetical protein ACE5GL_07255 [Calditrichia bacterium]